MKFRQGDSTLSWVFFKGDEMKYHAPTGQFTVTKEQLSSAATSLMYVMGHIRDMAKKPRTPYKHEGPLTPCEFACKGVIDAAKDIGIDLGANWGYQLDLTEYK